MVITMDHGTSHRYHIPGDTQQAMQRQFGNLGPGGCLGNATIQPD